MIFGQVEGVELQSGFDEEFDGHSPEYGVWALPAKVAKKFYDILGGLPARRREILKKYSCFISGIRSDQTKRISPATFTRITQSEGQNAMIKTFAGMVQILLDPHNAASLTAEEQYAWDSLKDLRDEDDRP